MKEGYWINYSTGKTVQVIDHEGWMREDGNPKKIGVPGGVSAVAGNIRDRDKYLMFLMEHSPIMRVRGHGNYATFEFHSHRRQGPMDAILEWGRDNAGPFTTMNIVNMATREQTQMSFDDFERYMESGGPDAVMRVASANCQFRISAKVARELLDISKWFLAV